MAGLRIDPCHYLEMPVRVHFYFKDDVLVQVTLNAKVQGPFEDIEPLFNRVAASLNFKMGAPVKSDRRVGVVSTARQEWVSGETRIVLIAIGSGSTVFLNLNYQPLVLPKKG